MRGHRREAGRTAALVDDLREVVDALRAGASLRSALSTFDDDSRFAGVAATLREGSPLVPTLHAAACGDDIELATACCVLAVHADAGGDPLPAVGALADRIAAQQATLTEARALTTQARLGARVILLMTPGFLMLLALSDPGGVISWLRDPRSRVAIIGGLVLQAFGAWWIAAIVSGAGGIAPAASVPLLRAVRAMLTGRARSRAPQDVAACADVVALVLDAGLSPTAALCAAAPYARGAFGDRLRAAVAERDVPLSRAMDALSGGDDAQRRFAGAVITAIQRGVPLAPAMRCLSDDIWNGERSSVADAVRRASVRVLLPLAFVILPAFVLTCLFPLFLGGLQGLSH